MTAPLKPRAKKPNLVVDVLDVAFGGDGIARYDGKVIFIEQAVPGETVEVELTQDKKRFAKAKVAKRLAPAPDAVQPFCSAFGRCGGCDWQQVPYERQLAWKAGFIQSAVQKSARESLPETFSVWPSSRPSAYRNRIKLKGRIADRISFGYFARGSHDRVVIESCPLAEPLLQDFMRELAQLSLKGTPGWQGEFEIQALAGEKVLCRFDPPLAKPLAAALQKMLPQALIQSSGFHSWEPHQGLDYVTQSGQFQQINRDGNRALREWVQAQVEALGAATVLDLFCGSGNLSLPLLDGKRRVWGLEWSRMAIESAEENLRRNGLTGGIYRSGPASELRSIFPDLPVGLDCVITDPPRQGMDDSLEFMLQLQPKHILSVSCDPNTFARDMRGILDAGYELVEIHGIDFFPQTYHVETLAHFRRI